MIFSLLLSFQAASAPLPKPLTDEQMRDIGCVATLGLVAHDQRTGKASGLGFPNVMERGFDYARKTGERIVAESGQSEAVIGFAINDAAKSQQKKLAAASSRFLTLRELAKPCLELLDKEVPEKQPGPADYLFCAAIISLAVDEITAREGKDSVNAKAMSGLKEVLTTRYTRAVFPPEKGRPAFSARAKIESEIRAEKKKQLALAKARGGLEAMSEAEGEEKYQRCIFLGGDEPAKDKSP